MENLYFYKVKELLSVYDGDTITVLLDLGMGIYRKEKIRFYGINTPELRGDERPEGLISKDFVINILKDKTIYIKTHLDKTGKYGRLLGEVYVDDGSGLLLNVNKELINQGLAEVKFY